MAKAKKTKELVMPDPATDPDDPDLPLHDAIATLLEAVRSVALPEASGGTFDASTLNFPRATVWAIATVGLLIDKRLAMSERHRG